jgi:nucleoside-diphosphate-sugar epimerase
VFISSIASHPQSASYYGRSKALLESSLDPRRDLIIRPGLILANDGGLFGRMRRSIGRTGVVPLFWGGRQIVQTIHVDDLCLAIERAIERGCVGALSVAELEGMPLRSFLRMLARELGRRPLLLPLPGGPVLTLLRLLERLGLRLPLSSENVLGIKAMRQVPTSADLALLGIRPRSARESLGDLLRGGQTTATDQLPDPREARSYVGSVDDVTPGQPKPNE